ncbi:MAG TPA: glycosyltransferase family 4 protein [Acidimicrobiales bacterium]|nr:glycosyltransferase family 4 protein [Acidimicrobiales bacterium]
MKLAFVVPRYGTEVTGGAETGARMLAERLVRRPEWSVEVLTTCARDAMTWEDAYRPGTVEVGGVTVHRFAAKAGRDPGFHPYSGRLLAAPEQATEEQASVWIDLQGPLCPEVVDAAVASDADVVAFYPYLYYPTVRGLPLVGRRGIMHPAAHDEAPIRLPVFDPVFRAAGGLVYHTYVERRLVQQLFAVAQTPQVVLGLGVDEAPAGASAELARRVLGLGERPYLCYVGRVDDQKGCGSLWPFFVAYKERHPGPLALVLAGQVVDRPPDHPDLVVPGPVSDELKWSLYAGAEAYVHPSAMESFSLVCVEAWMAGAPVMVNGTCHATVEHCARSGGGLWYRGFAEFEAALDRLLGDSALRGALAGRGREYVEANFAWPALLDRYERFVGRVADRAA